MGVAFPDIQVKASNEDPELSDQGRRGLTLLEGQPVRVDEFGEETPTKVIVTHSVSFQWTVCHHFNAFETASTERSER